MYYDGIINKPSLDELYHHGIKGQKWGVKNGPPYPLDKGRKQTKYGFKGSGGTLARKIEKAAMASMYATGGLSAPLAVPIAIGASARSESYKPGETTDKHYIKKELRCIEFHLLIKKIMLEKHMLHIIQ